MPKRKPLSLEQIAALPFHDARRLEIVRRSPSGRATVYADRILGTRYTQRAVQTARAAGFSPEQAAEIRRSGLASELDYIRAIALRRGVDAIQVGQRVRDLTVSYARAHDTDRMRALSDRKFWRALHSLETSKSNSPRSAKARALEFLGRRPVGAPWRVGDSPPGKRRAA